jgi:D-alanine-D-alanine ligase
VLEAAFAHLGHEPLRIGTPHRLLEKLNAGRLPRLDAALTIAEGYGSRNREAWAPTLLEMAGVPTLGSDALTLSLTLDKAWANRAVADAGVAVAPQRLIASAEEARVAELPAEFPLFVKPRWEGTSKGIRPESRVESREDLVDQVRRVTTDYAQPALVEAFLAGAEYTVTVVGHDPPRALPVLQRALHTYTRIGLHAVEGVHASQRSDTDDPDCAQGSGRAEAEFCLPGELSKELEEELQTLALRVFDLFECRDFARADFRLDAAGRPVFLEINPLPTFAVDGSFGILAELEGRSLESLLADVLAEGLARLEVSAAPASRPAPNERRKSEESKK